MHTDPVAIRPGLGRRTKGVRFGTPTSHLLALGVCTLMVWITMIVPQARHWFLIPIFICGLLIVPDMLDWIRGKIDIFDPVGLIGVFGALNFFAAPILHVVWDRWPLYLPFEPYDWRPWVGVLASLNVGGLLVYRYTKARFTKKVSTTSQKVWVIDKGKFPIILGGALLISIAAIGFVMLKFGGIGGYINAYADQRLAPFEGIGWLFTFSDSLAILAMFGYAVRIRRRGVKPTWGTLFLIVLAVLSVRLVAGGFRGSRNNVIWGLFWAVGIVHFCIRRIPRAFMYGGIAVVFLFSYTFAFYKGVGSEAFTSLRQSGTRASLQRTTLYDAKTVLLLDFGRSAIQAYIVSRLEDPHGRYEYARGRSYIGDVASAIPRGVWPGRPPGKIKEATELIYGQGRYKPGLVEATYVYGFAGEAMLNFGIWAVPISFVFLGLLVGVVRRKMREWHELDARWMIAPFLALLCPNFLTLDLDNIVTFCIQYGMVPFLVIAWGSKRVARNALPS